MSTTAPALTQCAYCHADITPGQVCQPIAVAVQGQALRTGYVHLVGDCEEDA